MSAETPSTVRSSRCSASSSRRSWTLTPAAKPGFEPYFPMSSLTTAMRTTRSARSWCVISATDSRPSTAWPPVIATASL